MATTVVTKALLVSAFQQDSGAFGTGTITVYTASATEYVQITGYRIDSTAGNVTLQIRFPSSMGSFVYQTVATQTGAGTTSAGLKASDVIIIPPNAVLEATNTGGASSGAVRVIGFSLVNS